MKVLQVNCVYGKGSTGKIVCDIHTELQKNDIESVVCYGRGISIDENNIYKTCGELYSQINNLCSRFTGIMYGGCFLSTKKLISIIKHEKPDIVHLHCINGYFVNIYNLITWLKDNKIKTVVTLHAEFMYTANCGHAFECDKWLIGCGNCPHFKKETKSLVLDGTAKSWKLMKKAFEGFEENCFVTSVSPWLMERAMRSPILGSMNHTTVLNGVDTGIFHPTESSLRNEYCINDKRLILHVTPSFSVQKDHIKGGWYVVELAKRMPDVMFAVIGNTNQINNLPKNIINVGRIEDQSKLSEWYSSADLTLLTSRRETFSMITAESLCCGTPVVGFKAGGPETIALPEYSEFVEYGNLGELSNSVSRWLDKTDEKANHSVAAENYSRARMVKDYREVYERML